MASSSRSAAPYVPHDAVPHVPLPARAATLLGWFRAIFWMAVYLAGTVVVLALAADLVLALGRGDIPHWWLAKLVGAVASGALLRIATTQLISGGRNAADKPTTATYSGSR